MKLIAPTLALVIAGLATTAHSQTPPAAAPPSDAASPAPTASAEPSADFWRVTASPYTYHYHPSEDHTNVYMLGLEWQKASGLLFGGSLFRNSFGQPSAYLYAGWRFDDFTPWKPLFAEVSGGLLYGYKPPYEDKVPFNHNGFSPGAVASIGWQFTKVVSAQVNFLGNSALMFQVSVDLH